MATKPAQKAVLLNKYFCSVFLSATPNVNIDPTNNSLRTDMEISQIQVSVDYAVTKHLTGLDTSKACGPDGISARLLKECSQQIAPSLCGIFNQSLSSGQIPTEWKSADITPIHKSLPKTTDRYHFFRLSAKSWNAAFLIVCMITSSVCAPALNTKVITNFTTWPQRTRQELNTYK